MAEPQPGVEQLDSTQQAALQTYIAVTNQDPTSAIPLLQRSQWNVNVRLPFTKGLPSPS